MHRFFVLPTAIQGDRVILTGPIVHQLTHVLRLRPGERVVVLDDSGWAYTVELKRLERRKVEGSIVERAEARTEPRTRITLYQAVLKGERFQWVLQKGTELGITTFVPMFCARSVVRDPEAVHKKLARWQTIIREAAEQSRRGRLPRLEPPLTFAQACQQAEASGGLSLLAWEGEPATSLKEVLRASFEPPAPDAQYPISNIRILIGPEGGFTPEEVKLAQTHSILPITLGRRILRAETAGLIAAAAIFYELNDLGQ